MQLFTVKKYKPSDKTIWNIFASKSNQDTFLFQRDFMDYHSDRFLDFSLMVYKKEKLIALLPANKVEASLYSHQGLSYGGMVTKSKLRFEDYVALIVTIFNHLKSLGIDELMLKELPSIYNTSLSGELEYILSYSKANCIKTDNYFVIDNSLDYQPNRNRLRALKKAEDLNLEITSDGIAEFWELMMINLNQRYNTKPVHTLAEIKLLKNRFPDQIQFFSVVQDTKVCAGAVLFIMENVVHFQYSAGDEERANTAALDVLFHHLILKYQHKKYVSFGSSATDSTLKINKGLSYWKESFGAKVIPQRTHKIEIISALNNLEIFQK
jgi:hypothetical protein